MLKAAFDHSTLPKSRLSRADLQQALPNASIEWRKNARNDKQITSPSLLRAHR
jgi:hypothetical protein